MRRWLIAGRDGQSREAVVRRVTPDYVEVEVDHTTVRLGIARTRDSVAFVMPSGRVAAPVVGPLNGTGVDVLLDGRCLHLSEVANGEAASRSSGSGQRRIMSQMPGRVVKVLVSPGEDVRAGQGIVILEAMKMENEVKAQGAGRVARVLVAEGDRVDAGAAMVEFE